MGEWTFFSNYGHVLVCLARNPEVRLRDVAADVGITERAVQKIVRDLQDANFLTISKHGRRNRYRVNRRKGLRHELESHCTVGKLLGLLAMPPRAVAAEPELKASEEAAQEAQGTADTAARAESEPETVKETAKENRQEQEKERKRAPVDTRQQGSLF